MLSLRRVLTVLAALTAVLTGATPALAHDEREVDFPDGTHGVPQYREEDPDLLVCKTDPGDFADRIAGFPAPLRERNEQLFARCTEEGFRHLQEAVNAVEEPGTTIALLPGEYHEEPYRAEPTGACAELDAPTSRFGVTEYQVLTWEQQLQCPHNQNLVAVLGIEDLQIEGTGAGPEDVVIDAGYTKLNAIRADLAHGIYLRNLTAQRTLFNAVYILATDGFVIDRATGRWNEEYGFLTFASDNGLYTGCEAYGNGDSGIYPGSASDINAGVDGYEVERYAIEITGCRSHHNMVGYSGTAGNSVWVHGNEFDHNQAGASMDSVFPGHPGLPQNHALFENNLIHTNNQNYYGHVRDGTCSLPVAERGYEDGVVCPAVSMPPGTGIITAGGNWNLFRGNHVYGHQRTGFYLTSAPAFLREETALGKQADTSHRNRYDDNVLGLTPDGEARPNRLDAWWDGQGRNNCWQSGTGSSNPPVLPVCGDGPTEVSGSSHRLIGEPAKMAHQLVCAGYDIGTATVPAGCDWYGARGIERVETQLALAVSVLLAAVGGMLWRRRLRHSRTAATAAALGAAGLVLNVVGATGSWAHTAVVPLALLLLGLWWTGTGLALRGTRPAFAWTTLALGGLALLDAFDKSVLLVPWLPVSPAWLQLLLGLVWVVWAVVVAAREPSAPRSGPAAEQREPAVSGA
ncbi:right-handed parallel beta-helix repeat-containing protein [Streptomyces sp. ACA25]|uniref:right-handed parallel beta-helix repeat-containing protein n=1 Tax=Streptomyces sp. ACA25 TaxID=3022596 RepID=UPI0023074CB3|nr:right-handed parallel beta-helix repeat-containing protein [Streptomyces sp. ACA25]MDB1089089.1 right-handed parallel beta-helix repeat-containing protein [Streptomyces sp. ACA25]